MFLPIRSPVAKSALSFLTADLAAIFMLAGTWRLLNTDTQTDSIRVNQSLTACKGNITAITSSLSHAQLRFYVTQSFEVYNSETESKGLCFINSAPLINSRVSNCWPGEGPRLTLCHSTTCYQVTECSSGTMKCNSRQKKCWRAITEYGSRYQYNQLWYWWYWFWKFMRLSRGMLLAAHVCTRTLFHHYKSHCCKTSRPGQSICKLTLLLVYS